MEPRRPSPEQLPPAPPNGESLPSPESLQGTEVYHGRNEAVERRLGHNAESAPQMAPPPAAALPTPVVAPDDTTTTSDSPAPDQSTPLVAADEDLIEKEWVDKAKKVISETKDDPYRRETEVKKLQVEYIRKRYGKVISDDE